MKFSPEDYTTEQVFYTASKDGTKVPMFIVYRNGLKTDSNNPVTSTLTVGSKSASRPGSTRLPLCSWNRAAFIA